MAKPVVILWTDPEKQWSPMVPILLESIPELLVFGDYEPEKRQGPAIWLRCVVDHTLFVPGIPADVVPIVYLPGVGRQSLRTGDDCPCELQPLVEWMFRGTLWLQRGGHDWTVSAFLSSPDALKLELAKDAETMAALVRALPEVAVTPIAQFRGQRLEAEDFDRLLTTDPVRELLRWMNAPKLARERLGAERWAAFVNQCRTLFRFDPEKDADTKAGRLLGQSETEWRGVWERFAEAPEGYPGIAELLRRSKPDDLFVDHPAHWPEDNDIAEESLRAALADLEGVPHVEACDAVIELERTHGPRRNSVWARLGQAKMAEALAPLAVLAEHARSPIGGRTPNDIARTYVAGGWRADAAAWQAMALASGENEEPIHDAVYHLLEPWADEGARTFQRALADHPLPTCHMDEPVEAGEGGCLFFADGLRYDLGRLLAQRLEGKGCRVTLTERWAAQPTVTATAKPAVTPLKGEIKGETLPDDFSPVFAKSGRATNAEGIRDALVRRGYQILDDVSEDHPASETARGWIETGEIDHLGHDLQAKLARQIDYELDRLVIRILHLLEVGWKTVRVVTDHGWLLLPRGLPKIHLPKHLTESRWARCATIAAHAEVAVRSSPWYWNPLQRYATPDGIGCFNQSPAYAHGGLSIEECLTPDLLVEKCGRHPMRATIRSWTWIRLRCVVEADISGEGIRADLRLGRPNGPSVASAPRTFDEKGGASVVLADDTHETADLFLVLIDADGRVLAEKKTKVEMSS